MSEDRKPLPLSELLKLIGKIPIHTISKKPKGGSK